MRSLKYLMLVIVFIAVFLPIKAQNLQVYFYYCLFDSPDKDPYMETYLAAVGKSLNYVKNDKGKFQAEMEITIVYSQMDDVKNFKKYNLKSPELDDTTGLKPNFIDQQRFSLPNGAYNFELSVSDNNADSSFFKYNDLIQVDFNKGNIQFSGVQFIESFTKTEKPNMLSKGGYDLVPYISNFYPENISELGFYFEVYNTGKILGNDEGLLISYHIRSYKSTNKLENLSAFTKKNAGDAIAILGKFPIDKLPSGNYNLLLEVRNQKNELLASNEVFFQRSNPNMYVDLADYETMDATQTFASAFTYPDTLKEYIRCLNPISDEREVIYAKNVVKNNDLKMLQNYFYAFWNKRNSVDPQDEWFKYYTEVKLVNSSYGTQINKGYETDRGRVYLQYGKPNQIQGESHDPSSYPWEIWQYYKIEDGQNNGKFVFYNPDIAGNDYMLLHSNVKGEIITHNWDMILHKRNTSQYIHEREDSDEYFGGKAKEIFNQ